MMGILNGHANVGDETSQLSQLRAIPEDAEPDYSSYMHMMCFLHTLALRPLFRLPAVNYQDDVSTPDAFGQNIECRCGTSGQQQDAKHVVVDLAMKYHRFLLEGYELWDLVPLTNSRDQ